MTINGAKRVVNEDDMPLVWVLRDILAMTGTVRMRSRRLGSCGARKRQSSPFARLPRGSKRPASRQSKDFPRT